MDAMLRKSFVAVQFAAVAVDSLKGFGYGAPNQEPYSSILSRPKKAIDFRCVTRGKFADMFLKKLG
jgi:hypothetical protein